VRRTDAFQAGVLRRVDSLVQLRRSWKCSCEPKPKTQAQQEKNRETVKETSQYYDKTAKGGVLFMYVKVRVKGRHEKIEQSANTRIQNRLGLKPLL